ncbi:MAG TPA: endo alpha-1,4 polygalactosaminidase [Bryobacteraceae bacterium]|nr:endo alpha-1,4 polygalactosaminidase [Bryobacteraceae bacterium]
MTINRSVSDPNGKKLIFGYIDVAEAMSYSEPDLFSGSSLPAWFGKPNPGYSGLYSVQYWNPAWAPEVFAQVDQLVATGYDGVFLDVLDGNQEWSQGNSLGNPVYANAVPAMATLVSQIRAHVNSLPLTRPFYLLGNNPSEIGASDPSSLRNLDAIFNEWVYYGQPASNGLTSEYKGVGSAHYIATTLAPIYDSANVPVLGGDYPLPLEDPNADMLSFEFYTQLGWIPSITTASQTSQILSTGPFMFVATPTNPIAKGSPGFVNYLSGGAPRRQR